MIKYRNFRQDNDGHWFLIPIDRVEEFDTALTHCNYDKINGKFWKYRCVDPQHIVVHTRRELELYLDKLATRLDEITGDCDVLHLDTLEYKY